MTSDPHPTEDAPRTPAERWLSKLSAAEIATLLDVDRDLVTHEPPVGPPLPSYYWHKRIFRSFRPRATPRRGRKVHTIVTKSAMGLFRMDLIDVKDLDRPGRVTLTEPGEQVVALLKARQDTEQQ